MTVCLLFYAKLGDLFPRNISCWTFEAASGRAKSAICLRTSLRAYYRLLLKFGWFSAFSRELARQPPNFVYQIGPAPEEFWK